MFEEIGCYEKIELKMRADVRQKVSELKQEIDMDWQIERKLDFINSQIEELLPKGKKPLWIMQLRRDNITPLKKKRDRLISMLKGNFNGDISAKHIDLAKSREITDFIDIAKQGNPAFALCPFHEDTHPSLAIYGNRFKCFSCGEFGDSIDLAQKVYGLSFIDTIKKLNNMENKNVK